MRGAESFLPDFCQIRSVFLLVMAAELLAVALTAAAPGSDPWLTLGLASLFVQWVALICAAGLCALGRVSSQRLSAAGLAMISYLLILLVTALMASAAAVVLPARPGPGWLLRCLVIAAVVGAIVLRYFYVAHQWRRRVEGEAAARVEALQARIRPHFLFNSLNTIAAMIPDRPGVAEAAVEDLADLFRASLGGSGRLVPLADELDLARRYLRIEELRLGERLSLHWQVDALPGDALVPPLTLQPLLENAVYHGIEPRMDGGVIAVNGRHDDSVLHITIENPAAPTGAIRRGAGMALDNVRARLDYAFGDRARLRLERGQEGYRLELDLPYERDDEDSDR